jgi:alanyl-tRNA synthetase
VRSTEIRRTFLDFFRERGHRVWPSSSLIPNDPTMLLTIAGMVQFKPYFLGEDTPEVPRATSVQKVARTNDIENVGVTTRHFTFFEMLGNFSFGDYFKADAIRWAYELSTQGFGMDPERLWATVYLDDDEAIELWLAHSDIPIERIVRRGAADNFWTTGGAGPCGPCSEIYYDRGPDYGAEGGPEVDESRYLEFWNLVFMQSEQDADGNILAPLPRQNVDTGLGLERLAMLLQDVPNVYETDVMRPMIDRAAALTGVAYGAGSESDVSLRVMAEHARSSAMLISDGVLPSNEARGYILRRLLRRVVRHTRMLGLDKAVMPQLMDTVIETLGEAWPDLRSQSKLITRVAASEEESFSRTLRSGLQMLDEAIVEAKEAQAEGAALPAETAFTLHDTFGFPIDLTVEIAAEHGLSLDRDAFAGYMEGQRTRDRRVTKDQRNNRPAGPASSSTARPPSAPARARSSATPTSRRTRASARSSCPAGSSRAPRRATRSRSSCPRPRSTPRAAASSATTGSSRRTPAASRCSTPSRRCRGSSSTAVASSPARSAPGRTPARRSTGSVAPPSVAATPRRTSSTRR